MTSTEENSKEDEVRYTGKVKWFNNKEGYGFITVCDNGEYLSKDIFVHYSSICVENTQYKYLVQGEYVEFNLIKVNSEKHETQAVNISGIKGGPLMCESKQEYTMRSNQENVPRQINNDVTYVRQSKKPKVNPGSSNGFTIVKKK
jgi:cold shock CspA family protein